MPTNVGMFASTDGRRRTPTTPSGVSGGKAAAAMLGTGTNGFSRSSAADGCRPVVVIVSAAFAVPGIGFGAAEAASISDGVADSGFGGGNLMGCTAEVAAEEPAGSTAAGAGRGATGGAAVVFASGGPIGPVIRQTIA